MKSSVTTGKDQRLKRELLLLGGRERVHVRAARRAVIAQRLLDQGVDVGVRVERVVVEERELLHPRLLGEGQRLLVRRVPEPRVRLVLLLAVLRVVDEKV